MENDYYTYAYLRKDGTPYYIGKGKEGRAYRKTGRRGCQAPENNDRILILKTGLTEEEAFKHEIYMIAVLGRKNLGTGVLRNLTNGGDGVSGIKFSEESKLRMSLSQKGRKHSEETKRKIGEGNKGKVISPEHKEKIGNTHRGKIETLETRKKKSASHKGKKLSPETIEKMKRPKSEETRRRMSEAQRRRWGVS